ncbi:hypothetical protein PR44_10360 [Salmonella enterica]|nr:hypothetical protein [Salmonella enterica]EBH3687097.1 hypothetical protein [Salmonella enterica]
MNADVIWFLGICGTIFTALFSCAYKEPDFYIGYVADKLFKATIFGGLFAFLAAGVVQTFSEHAIRKLEKLPDAAEIVSDVWEQWHRFFLIAGLCISVMFLVWCFLEWVSRVRKTYLNDQKKN